MILDDKYRIDESGCWLWLLSKDRTGYGHICIDGKLKQAHRVSYESHNGKIPHGAVIMHTCDVRHCINPEHLVIGDQKLNCIDSVNKGRWGSRKTNRKKKLTESDVKRIKNLLSNGFNAADISRILSLGFQIVYQVTIGKTWKTVI